MANGSVVVLGGGGKIVGSGLFAAGDLIGVWVPVRGDFLLALGAFAGSIAVEYSPDQSEAFPLYFSDGSTPWAFADFSAGRALILSQPDPGGFVRLNATGVTSYPTWRIAGTPG